MKSIDLQKHVFSTYVTLRYGAALLAFIFPIWLYAFGKFRYGIDLGDSMSSYYFLLASENISKSSFPMRTWFVGLLFAIGFFLYLYKGFSDKENYALNIAGICAGGVAIFPMTCQCIEDTLPWNPHGTFAVVLFLCIGFVSIFCTKDTLFLLRNPALEARFLWKYRVCGVFMIGSPLVALVVTFLLQDFKRYVFFIEGAGIWAFAGYWWVKSQELALSGAEKEALHIT